MIPPTNGTPAALLTAENFERFRDFLQSASDALDAPGQVVRGAIGYHLPDLYPAADPPAQSGQVRYGPSFVQTALHQLTYGGTPEDARADWEASAAATREKYAGLRAMRDAGAGGLDIYNAAMAERPGWARTTAHVATNPLNYAWGAGRAGLALAQSVEMPSWLSEGLQAAAVAAHASQAVGQVVGRAKAFTPPPDVARALLRFASGDTSAHPDDPDVVAQQQFDQFVRYLHDRATGSAAPTDATGGR